MRTSLSQEEQSEQKANQRRVQLEMLELQSDKKKLEHKQEDIHSEIKRMENDIAHLKKDLETKKAATRSLEREIALADEAITRSKKHLNAL